MRPLLLWICIISGNLLSARQPGYNYINYTTANGLADNKVHNILQDSRGFMWFATQEGLSRYDGSNFKNFFHNKNDPASLPGNNVTSMFEFRPGYLLLSCSGKATMLNTYTQEYKVLKDFMGRAIFAMRQLGNDAFEMSTIDTAFIVNNDLKIVQTLVPPVKYKRLVPEIWRINDSTLLVATIKESFFYNTATKSYKPFLSGEKWSPIDGLLGVEYYDPQSDLVYLSSYWEGLYCFSSDGGLVYKWDRNKEASTGIPDCNINFIVRKNDSTMWLGGNEGGGIMTLDTRTKLIRKLVGFSNSSYNNEKVSPYAICTDKDNNDWVATNNGIRKLNAAANHIKTWRTSFSLLQTDDIIVNISKGKNGAVFVPVFGRSWCYMIPPGNDNVTLLDNTKFPPIWSASQAGDQIMFSGGGTSITKYNVVNGKYSQSGFLKPYFPTSDIVTLAFRHSNGDEWYSGNNGGGFVRVSTKDGTVHHYLKDGPNGNFRVSYYSSVAEDRNGDLWFGVNKSANIVQWDLQKDHFNEVSFDTVKGTKGVYSGGITDLTTDADNNIWISLESGGIIKYDPYNNTAIQYTQQDGLPTDYTYALRFDNKGRLWIATAKGLSCMQVKEGRFVNFNIEDGLPADEFDEHSILYDSNINRLWVASKNTLMQFDPDTLLNTFRKKILIYIDEILVNGKKYTDENFYNISFLSNENSLLFHFIAPELGRGRNIEYSYMLTGVDKNWVYSGDAQRASYINLASGDYTFKVRARHKGDNTWVEMLTPTRFNIDTPWYRTWWFKTMIGLLFITIAWYLVRSYYQRKLEKQRMLIEKELAIEQERNKMARELHDGLGSMLSGIKHSFSALQTQLTMEEQHQLKFHYNIDRLNDSIKELRGIAHNMATESSLKYGLENSLKDYCANISQSSGIPITFLALDANSVQLTEEQSFHCFRIIQELLQNMSKHSAAKHAIVQISYQDHRFQIAVEDDGKGFDLHQSRNSKGIGLKNIESRVKILKGNLDCRTEPGKGTSVLIEIPC